MANKNILWWMYKRWQNTTNNKI